MLTGIVLGALVGGALLMVAVVVASAGSRAANAPGAVETGLRDVLHAPPLLVERGQEVTLRYDAICEAGGLGAPCVLAGSVYVRRAGESAYSRVPLSVGEDSSLAAVLPPDTTALSGFAYYAVISDGTSQTTVPSGGAVAPHNVWVMPAVESADLGTHVFGRTREPDGIVVRASWGSGDGALGLVTGPTQSTIGPSAFDLAPNGDPVVLDQINGRLAFYEHTDGRRPRYVPISFTGGDGDLAVGGDGTIYVLDRTGTTTARVRSFTPSGAPVAAVRVGAVGTDMLRAAPGGVLAHGYPGDMWLPVARAGSLVQPRAQIASSHAGLALKDGAELIVKAGQQEDLLALVHGDRVVRAWRVTSSTPLGEVQLAEAYRDGLVAVVRVWTDQRAEFVVLVLSPAGLESSFALDAVEWAESAPLGRFRLSGNTLYQLRSAREGVEISTVDLGGAR
jgi:hypothetical protein